MEKDTITCPRCNHIQEATIQGVGLCAAYVHTCVKCVYVIMESEWNSLGFDRNRCYSLDEIKETGWGFDEPRDFDGVVFAVVNGKDGREYWFIADGHGWKVDHVWEQAALLI